MTSWLLSGRIPEVGGVVLGTSHGSNGCFTLIRKWLAPTPLHTLFFGDVSSFLRKEMSQILNLIAENCFCHVSVKI